MATQIVKAPGGIPVGVVSGEDKKEYCMKLGAKGVINRKEFSHWGMMPHWKDNEAYNKWLRPPAPSARPSGTSSASGAARASSSNTPAKHRADLNLRLRQRRHGRDCAGTTGYNAVADLRYLWMRQKRFQGSHFANDEQSNAINQLALGGQLDPCMSRAFPYDDVPLVHQLMHDNKHPHGNMAVLVGASEFGLGATGDAPIGLEHPALPKDDVHTTPHPYPMSVPLPSVAEAEPATIADDGAKVSDMMHRGIISCTPADSVGKVARTMIENDIHAVVVMEGGKTIGVVSQTDMVLARQGRTADEDPRPARTGHHDARLFNLRRRHAADRSRQPDDRATHASAGRHRERSTGRGALHDRRRPQACRGVSGSEPSSSAPRQHGRRGPARSGLAPGAADGAGEGAVEGASHDPTAVFTRQSRSASRTGRMDSGRNCRRTRSSRRNGRRPSASSANIGFTPWDATCTGTANRSPCDRGF